MRPHLLAAALFLTVTGLACSSDDSAETADAATTVADEVSGETDNEGEDQTGSQDGLASCGEIAEQGVIESDATGVGSVNGELTGTIGLSVDRVETSTETLPATYEGDTEEVPQGQWFAVRYTATNDTDREFQVGTSVGDHLHLTDGERVWEVVDYTNGRGGISSDWATDSGDSNTSEYVGPGFSVDTWAVFDVPEDAEPTALAFGVERLDGPELWGCLSLPASEG